MKKLRVTIFLLLTCFLNIKAQDSNELSQLTPCPIPPKLTRRINRDFEYIVYSEPIKIFVGIETKILSDGKTAGIIKYQTNSHELTWTNAGEKISLVAKLNYFFRITSIDKSFDRCFDEKSRYSFKEDEVNKKISILYQKAFELPKGIYALEFVVRDNETGKIGEQKIKFEIK